jgi:anthranilate phosphoribosyltransferase
MNPIWPSVLGKLVRREDLQTDEAVAAMSAILSGEATSAQIAGFAVALRAKGETPTELAALARTMRSFGERVEAGGGLVDTCGTGGDGSNSVNVSTMAALVVAGAGARVAKHGNRSASSECGSADLLEHLGVAIDVGPVGVARCIDEAGIGFCFAPRFHGAMRHAGPTRRELGVRTTFNFLGPLANPAGVLRQVIGVSDPAMASPMVAALSELGAERVWVVFGHDGLDELSTTGSSTVWELRQGQITTWELGPGDFGLAPSAGADLKGGGPAENAAAALALLDGKPGPVRDIVCLNAAGHFLERAHLHGKPDAVKHEPRGFLRDAERPRHLVGADSVLAVGEHPDGGEPFVEAERGILEDRPHLDGKLPVVMQGLALPHAAGGEEPGVVPPAGRADNYASRPADRDHVGQAQVGIGEVADGLEQGLWGVLNVFHAPSIVQAG